MHITHTKKEFFKSNKKIVLVTGLLTGSIIANSIAYFISDSRYLLKTAEIKKSRDPYCFCNYEPQSELDKIVWDEEYENDEVKIGCTSLLDTTIIKVRVYRGTSKSTHYRVSFIGTDSVGYPREELAWNVLPENNIIIFNIQDITEEKRYKKYINITFGTYNPELDIIEENNREFLTRTSDSQEIMNKHEEVHKHISDISRELINESDSDFDKVKKIYDYLIAHTEYRYSEEGIYLQTVFGKYYMECDGYADFMNLALNSVGVESFCVFDWTHGHVWNIVKVDNEYYHLDACFSDTSSWYNTSKYRYFLVSDEFMLADHRFFVSEKDVECNNIYDLKGIVSKKDVMYRGFRGEQINPIEEEHKIGEYEDGGYNLGYRLY